MTKTLIVLTHDTTGEKYVVEAPEGFHAGGGSVSAELQQVHTKDDLLSHYNGAQIERELLLLILKALYETGRIDIAAQFLRKLAGWSGGECIAALEEWFNATRHARRQPVMESGADWATLDSERTVEQTAFIVSRVASDSWALNDPARSIKIAVHPRYLYDDHVQVKIENDAHIKTSALLKPNEARDFANALLYFANEAEKADNKANEIMARQAK